MMKRKDFENGVQRLLILLYDNVRGNGEHDLNNCKHLACSEVRASLFVDKCSHHPKTDDKSKGTLDAFRYCLKNVAINNLKLKNKCHSNAAQYVDYVFSKCVTDKSPFNKSDGARVNMDKIYC